MPVATPYAPPAGPVPVLHADAHLLVVDKPSGLLSVPGRGEGKEDCVASRLQADFPDARIVHRLDMGTSGLLVLARGAEAHRRLSMLFQGRQVGKRYVAVVAGLVADDSGSIDLPLITDWPNRPKQMVDPIRGKPSLTRYRVAARDAGAGTSRVELQPVTGRSHQLRVHLLALGHPILGDDLYGDAASRNRADRLLLHAAFLSFIHPFSGQALAFACPAPF